MDMDRKLQNFSNKICLHCTAHNPKLKYHEIFKDLGAEIGLQALLAKYFNFKVENSTESSLLCEVCVNSLIRCFDINELEREQQKNVQSTGKRKVQITSTSKQSNEATEKSTNDEASIYDFIFKSDEDLSSTSVLEEGEQDEDVANETTNKIDQAGSNVDDTVNFELDSDQELEAGEDDIETDGNVMTFNFVDITEKDDIADLNEYLATVVRTKFENLSFVWITTCKHCSFSCSDYQSLLNHMLKHHKTGKDQPFECPIDSCLAKLKNKRFLAMHLVMLHGPVNNIPIYGSCPECKLTFSNIFQYNKHSCAHVIKKKRGIRLFCEMCSIEFPSWKRFNFHIQFHLERHRPRACFICNYADTNIADLFQHLHYAHEPDGTFFCNLCDRIFRDEAIFLEHNKSHANASSTTYTCIECFINFDTRSRLNGHMRSMHGTFISCEICSREFSSESTYNVHMKKHLIIEREVHLCRNCGQLSENENRILQHIETKSSLCHKADICTDILRNAYMCEYCSCYFRDKSDLHNHRLSGVHNNGLFWCQPCSKEFSDMKLYRHHLRNFQQLKSDTEHQRFEICLYYMCDQKDCFESYVNWNSLYTHKRRTHSSKPNQIKLDHENPSTSKSNMKDKPEWECQFCEKQCRSKMSLSVHVARSHNNDNVVCSICNSSYKNQAALDKHHAYWHEPIECPKCFKVVKNRRNFNTHENVVHSNNKRYSCEICEKGFYHKSEMKAHQKLHSQLYSCKRCNFSTRNKTSLSVHIMGQHFKRFAFACKMCSKRFGRSQGLTNHMQRVHGTKYSCEEYFAEGCSRSFASTAQLSQHVKKVHKSNIFLPDDILEEDLSLEEGEVESKIAPPSSKKRCFQINDTKIEFIEEGAENSEESLDEDQDLKEDGKKH